MTDDKSKKKLILVVILSAFYFSVQIVAGLIIGSLALISDAGHMLVDVCGLVIALLAISFSHRPATPNRTYGFIEQKYRRRY